MEIAILIANLIGLFSILKNSKGQTLGFFIKIMPIRKESLLTQVDKIQRN
jgi:hypothetical protein